MPLRPNMEPQDYLAIILRWKWLIIFSILLIVFGASVYCVVVPEQYKSTTTILVIPQRVPESYVRSTVSVRIEDRLATIQQQVMSRTRLLSVMEELGLFKEERKNNSVEGSVERMRKRIEIQVRGNDAFTLSFVHENRQMAMLTASRLASFFIDENLKAREQQAVGTSEFLDSQLKDTKGKLEAQEEKVKRYKMYFMGELPQQMEANLNMLRGLQDQFRTNADAIRAASERKIFLESQIGALERSSQTIVQEDGRVEQVNFPPDPVRVLEIELAGKKAQLQDLLSRYTERYPLVLRTRNEIEQLEKRIIAVGNAPRTEAQAQSKPPQTPRRTQQSLSPGAQEMIRLRAQLSALEQETSSLKNERGEIQKRIAGVQAKVEQSPRREQEMIALTRDYDNLKRSYDDLLRKKLEADISQNLEKRQKGEQFQIIDPASLPEKPFKPNRRAVFGIALLAAIAVGFGGAFGFEALTQTLRGVKDFKHLFAYPVLATIPVYQDKVYQQRLLVRKYVVLGGMVSFTVALTVFLLLYGERIRMIILS